MELQRVAYAFVEAGGPVPKPAIATVSAGIAEYLEAHRDDLVERAIAERLAEAHFSHVKARQRFEQLAGGSDSAFETAAVDLAKRLHKRMDKRSRRGFFVAATFAERNGDGRQGVVLKLDASDDKLAAIGGTKKAPRLESVDDLLDIPGQLQKGAVFPDPRDHSEVCVGDKDRETSLYYLAAIDVEQNELPGKGITSLLRIIEDVDRDQLEPVLEALDDAQGRISADQVLANADLPAAMREDIEGRLAQLKRPVTDVDPTDHTTIGIVQADGITIRGPASRIRNDVTWRQDGAGYVIEVRVGRAPAGKHYQ